MLGFLHVEFVLQKNSKIVNSEIIHQRIKKFFFLSSSRLTIIPHLVQERVSLVESRGIKVCSHDSYSCGLSFESGLYDGFSFR